jgi:hypothetical protein
LTIISNSKSGNKNLPIVQDKPKEKIKKASSLLDDLIKRQRTMVNHYIREINRN